MSVAEVRAEFRRLHEAGCFVMPNVPDAGSARLLAAVGATAIATTSSGFAATLGRRDMSVTRDELVAHTGALAAAVTVPVSVDAERGFADDATGVAETVGLLAAAGAAGCSIEDWDPVAGRIDPIEDSVARVRGRRGRGARGGHGAHRARASTTSAASTISTPRWTGSRRTATRAPTRSFAPGLRDLESVARVVAVGLPVNVLVLPGAPPVAELAAVGVRRISVGGMLTWTMYGALVANARHLLEHGTLDATLPLVDRGLMNDAFA